MDSTIKMYNFMLWRMVSTLLIIAIFLTGSLIYVGFYGNSFSILQKIIVVLVSLIRAALFISLLWIVWMKEGMTKFNIKAWQEWKGFR